MKCKCEIDEANLTEIVNNPKKRKLPKEIFDYEESLRNMHAELGIEEAKT